MLITIMQARRACSSLLRLSRKGGGKKHRNLEFACLDRTSSKFAAIFDTFGCLVAINDTAFNKSVAHPLAGHDDASDSHGKAEGVMSNPDEVSDQFVSLLTIHQSQLKGYVYSSLGNRDDAQDVLQRTNLTLWKKAAEYRTGEPFLAWAFGVARYEVLGYLRDRNREQERVVFHSDVVAMMCDVADAEMGLWPDRQLALHQCLEELDEQTRQVFALRYAENRPLQQIAETTHKTIDAIKSLMLRSRKALRKCIEHRLASAETA
ncbi:RNA polymerase sigma-70 factor, Rhodopirellula/Verrucomicrobium family [Neorhodopirellula lusitana]|uniref:RNA polymerase sigma-70 factor, Rhodopirellula/Verrucomicrobium family n=2 Tax=Neorhodopirellula lusitana TaxID=445327 RepID=A0ABY1Q4L2_9BACT|nr:RNA polymerase sigma-70 factor, Rhodopirellula/Verrucomicrobium family [Neorhodopirellula lusitana]